MSELSGKKLLILGGASLHKKVVEAAKDMGIYTIVTDYTPNAPAKLIADKSYDINISDVDEIVEMCKREKVEAVISVCLDFCQIYYQQICEKLGLTCYGNINQFEALTNKQLFKELCVANGVDVIPTYEESDFMSGNSDKVVYPILVKPSKSNGSRGQQVCYDFSTAVKAINDAKSISGDGKAVIEAYMGGKPDFQVTCMVINGEPYVVRTADRYLGDKELGMDRVAIALSSPSKYTELYYNNVHTKIKRFIKNLGLVNAPIFFQGFVDGDTIRFYDPGLRFPGGDYDRIFADVMGFNLMKYLIELSFTGSLGDAEKKINNETVFLNGHTIFTLHSTIRPGVISTIPAVDELTDIKGVSYAAYRHSVGDTIGFTADVNQRIAEINIVGESVDAVIETIKEVQRKMVVLDTNNENMIFCEFVPEKLLK